jgi:hypothetical protein
VQQSHHSEIRQNTLKTSSRPNETIRSPATSLIYRADFILHSSALSVLTLIAYIAMKTMIIGITNANAKRAVYTLFWTVDMLVRYVVEKYVNGPIVQGKAAIVAIKPSAIIAINEPVFPR